MYLASISDNVLHITAKLCNYLSFESFNEIGSYDYYYFIWKQRARALPINRSIENSFFAANEHGKY